MKGISSADLMHHRLQAWAWEHTCKDIEYLGFLESYKSGEERTLCIELVNMKYLLMLLKAWKWKR